MNETLTVANSTVSHFILKFLIIASAPLKIFKMNECIISFWVSLETVFVDELIDHVLTWWLLNSHACSSYLSWFNDIYSVAHKILLVLAACICHVEVLLPYFILAATSFLFLWRILSWRALYPSLLLYAILNLTFP